jgi:hypothetical protein
MKVKKLYLPLGWEMLMNIQRDIDNVISNKKGGNYANKRENKIKPMEHPFGL